MKLTIHKETLYIISIVLYALGTALSVTANLGASVYSPSALALSYAISNALPASWGKGISHIIGSQPFSEIIIYACFLVVFCIVIRKFRPAFLLSFLTTFIYAVVLYAIQWIPAFWPDVNHNYPLYLRIILLLLSICCLPTSVGLFFKGYLYPPTIVLVQKGLVAHYHIKKGWIVVLAFDITFMLASIFIIYAIYQDWQFWNYHLSYGTLLNVIFSGPIVGLVMSFIDKHVELKTFFPKLETKLEIEKKKGY